MERINIRIFGNAAEPGAAIPAFHSWIQQNLCPELLIDVVDYRHVPGGPGVVLIGHEADYGLSQTPHGIALTYSRKAKLEAADADKIAAAFQQAVIACERLHTYSFDTSVCEIIVNDRIGTPNNDANWDALQKAVTEVFGHHIEIVRKGEPRSRLTALVSSKTDPAVSLRRQTVAAH